MGVRLRGVTGATASLAVAIGLLAGGSGAAAATPTARPVAPPGPPPRIAAYGDSVLAEAGQDFTYLAGQAGAPVLLHAFGGVAICDDLATMSSDAQAFRPTVAVLAFSGDNFTSCMTGYPLDTAQYFAKYRQDAQAAISIFRAIGARVVIVGMPLDESPGLSANVTGLDQVYQSLAASTPGVSYDPAGQAVLDSGRFTFELRCLAYEPCTGPSGTNIVRAPDGVHFCPDGHTTLEGNFEICDVYSSGAFRFAAAMLGPVLNPANQPSASTTSSVAARRGSARSRGNVRSSRSATRCNSVHKKHRSSKHRTNRSCR